MEDSFRVRVNKIFGSLPSSSSSSSSLSSSWRLSDEEVERREWNRDKESPDNQLCPYPPSRLKPPQKTYEHLRRELEDDLQDLGDDDFDQPWPSRPARRDGVGDADEYEWEIRSSIGLDCTLDNEEEEDEYDKVAVGKEKPGDRLYMRDVHDCGIDLDSHKMLPHSFQDVTRDPRANHMAAKIRLKEDDEAAKNFTSLQVSDNSAPAVEDFLIHASEDGVNLKSILKRKENQTDQKSEKRVRFDPSCKNDHEEESKGIKDIEMDSSVMEETTVPNTKLQNVGVPDYVRNPSKYTCYTLDSSSEMDEKSNKQAFMEFLNLLKKCKTESQPDDISVELPKSVAFIPKKRGADATIGKDNFEFKEIQEGVGKNAMLRRGLSVGIAAGEAEESEVRAMEEDAPEIAVDKGYSTRKQSRQYRSKARFVVDESVT